MDISWARPEKFGHPNVAISSRGEVSSVYRRSLGIVSVSAAGALLVAACASGGSTSGAQGSGHGPLSIAIFNPWSGADATYGPEGGSGCYAAAKAVNAAGGVLGHNLTCMPVDTKGDPVDAVPIARKMIATTSGLVGILGPSSDEASATAPVLNAAHLPMMADTGQPSFDHTSEKYFWRNTPSDDFYGYAMALYGNRAGFRRAALVFGNDTSDQGTVPTLVKGWEKLGGQVAVNEALALDQSSYNAQVARVIAAKPDVIFDEFDPQTAGTFFKEYFQQGGAPVPMVSTGAQYTAWIKAVKGAMGPANLAKVYRNLLFSAASNGPAWNTYKQYLLAQPAQVKSPSQYLYDPFAQSTYDGTTEFALAMLAAKSTNPVTWNNYIARVSNPHPGAVVVHTFAAGKRALAAGKSIDFVGCLGQTDYDRWHNSNGYFAVFGYNAKNGQQPLLTSFPAADATRLLNG